MDIVTYLKLGIKELGANKFQKDKRLKENKARRTSLRNKIRDAKRNMGSLTPMPIEKQVISKNDRIEKLLKWKKEKGERLAKEKAIKDKAKPVFRVSSFINTISIDTAMNTIKGKSIPKLAKKVSSKIYQFANPGHEFNFKAVSSSIKPRMVKTTETKKSVQKPVLPIVRVATRSQKQLFVSPIKELKPVKRKHTKSSSSSNQSCDARSDVDLNRRIDIDDDDEVSANDIVKMMKTTSKLTQNAKNKNLHRTLKSDQLPKPHKSIKSDTSTKPDKSSKPDKCSKPDIHTKPNRSTKPDISTKPNRSIKPNRTTKPDKTTKPEKSIKLDQSKKTNQNTKLDKSTKPEKRTNSDKSTNSNIVFKPDMNSKPNNISAKSENMRKSENMKKELKLAEIKSENIEDKIDSKVTIRKSKKYLNQPKIIKEIDLNESKCVEALKNETDVKAPEIINTSNPKSPASVHKLLTSPITPQNQTVPVYISPFVTMSRGKDKARNEYKQRSSRGGFSETTPENTGVKAGAAYFRNLLDLEIARIEEVCKEWNAYEANETPIEEACDMIHVAIGQSTLLTTKRMNQFRGLIDKCEHQDSDPLITCKDLHGFWDVLLTQVNNLNKRFENLARLKDTNWEEVQPDPKAMKPVVTRKRQVAKKAVKATSSIKDAIKAARKKAAEGNVNCGDKNIFAESKSNSSRKSIRNGINSVPDNLTPKLTLKPQIKLTPIKTPVGRKSLLQSVLSAQINRRTTLSPCVAMMRVASVEKQLNLTLSEATPSKSILKQSSKSTQKKGKSVFFIEETANDKPTCFSSVNDENDLNALNNDEAIEIRKSNRTRLSRSKLF